MATNRADSEELPEAPRILVLETGLVGELLVITPALRAIRKARPSADVTVVATPGSAPVLVGNPNVDRLLPLAGRERRGFFGLMRLASWIRAKRFDVAFVFHTSFRSALAAAMGAVPVRAGLSCEGRGFLLTHRTARDRSAYEVDEHLGVLRLLGIPADGRELELHLTAEEREEARRLLPERDDGRPVVGLHPGASREIRRWPAERFAELGAELGSLADAAVFYTFGPREHALAAIVRDRYAADGLPEPVTTFPRNLRVLGGLFAEADAVVTNNTGPMHIAAAVGVPGVFIHGPTPVARWQPPGDRYVPIMGGGVECRPRDSPRCRKDSLECMDAVTVAQVLEAVVGLFRSGAAPGRNGAHDYGSSRKAVDACPGQ